MRTIKFVVYGEPTGKGRPKASVLNGYAHVYTPKKTVNYEGIVKQAFVDTVDMNIWTPLRSPLYVRVTAYFGLNKSDYTPKGKLNNKGQLKLLGRMHCVKKPDLDNIYKIVTDALNKLAYEDDSQITLSMVQKKYSETPRVEVELHYYEGE